MVVVDFVLQEILDPINHAVAASHHAVNSVPGMIPERETHVVTLAIIHGGGRLIHGVVVVGSLAQKADFLYCEQASNEQVAVAVEVRNLVAVENWHWIWWYVLCLPTAWLRKSPESFLFTGKQISIFPDEFKDSK